MTVSITISTQLSLSVKNVFSVCFWWLKSNYTITIQFKALFNHNNQQTFKATTAQAKHSPDITPKPNWRHLCCSGVFIKDCKARLNFVKMLTKLSFLLKSLQSYFLLHYCCIIISLVAAFNMVIAQGFFLEKIKIVDKSFWKIIKSKSLWLTFIKVSGREH